MIDAPHRARGASRSCATRCSSWCFVGASCGALGVLDRALRAVLQRRVARARDVPRAGRGRAARAAAGARRGGRAGRRGRGDRAGRAGARRRRRQRRGGRGHEPVRRSARCSRSRPPRRRGCSRCCSATCWARATATSSWPAGSAAVVLGGHVARPLAACSPSASTAPARAPRASRRSAPSWRCWSCWPSPCWSACRGWATCSSWPCSSPRPPPRGRSPTGSAR